MKIDIKDLVGYAIIFTLCFVLSFVDYSGIYLFISYPLALTVLLYKESYYFLGVLGIFCASFVLGLKYSFLTLVVGVVLTLGIFTFLKNKRNALPIAGLLSSLSFGFVVSMIDYLFLSHNSYKVVVALLLFAFFGYFFSKIFLTSKFKPEKTITCSEFLILSLILSYVVANLNLYILDEINLSLILSCLIVYSTIRINTFTGIVCCLINSFFYSITGDIISLSLILMIFLLFAPYVKKNLKTGIILYFLIIVTASINFKNYSYIDETVFISLMILVLKPLIFIRLQNYIVDPKDYKLREYKEKYNMIVNKNKTIESLATIVEEKFKSNPKMKKKYNDKILENLNFLMNKIQQEPEKNQREMLLESLEYLDLELIGFNLKKDYQGEYEIDIEVRNYSDYNKILNCLKDVFQVRFELVSGKYNFLTNTMKYKLSNKDEYRLDFYVKQRSIDVECGDNYMHFSSNNKQYFLISDGMGHGKKADEDSKFALMLLKEFISLGMEEVAAIKACNALVYSKNDTYNTLDLLVYNSYSNEIILYKNGSGNSYVLYKDNVDKLSSESLPLGIIDEISVNKIVINHNVEKIILTSDGIDKNIAHVIKENGKKTLKELVDKIFINQDTMNDDQTIMAISVIKN